MPKFQKGQTVWGAVFEFGAINCAPAEVESCGEKTARLSRTGSSAAFGYRVSVPVDSVFATELEALVSLEKRMEEVRDAAELALQRSEDNRRTVADAIARLVGVTP